MKKYFNNVFWRWHFYAAIFIKPLLITLSISGIMYLFYPEVENKLNHDLLFEQTNKPEQSLNDGIDDILKSHPGYHVMKISFLKDDYNTRVSIMGPDDASKVVYLDHHNQVKGEIEPSKLFSNFSREMHSNLLTGNTFINYLVELASCWAIFLIITGLFMTFFRKYITNSTSKIKRKNQAKFHAMLGTILSIPLLLIVLTGLPWSGFMGAKIYDFAVNHSLVGYPESVKTPPVSNNEIAWATRGEHTDSKSHDGNRLPITHINELAKEEGFKKPYSITVPMDDKGTYVLSKAAGTGVTGLDASPLEERTIHLDQYSGMKLAIYDFDDYGPLAKFIAVGIPLHEGNLFGLTNKIINLLFIVGLLTLTFFGIKIYLMRRQKGKLSTPKAQPYMKYTWFFVILLILMGILMPLFGFSLIIIAIIELILLMSKKKYAI